MFLSTIAVLIWGNLTLQGFAVISTLPLVTGNTAGTSGFQQQEPYPWKEKSNYYYASLEEKMKIIMHGNCRDTYVRVMEASNFSSMESSQVFVADIPPPPSLVDWWRSFPRPSQMRVEPYLCDVVTTKRLPIFENSGCQLPHYMSPSAPRCQTKYLKWICDNARTNTTNATANGFILPESDHQRSFLPPIPWLLMTGKAFVSMCGHIVAQCGLIHTNANCMATGYLSQGVKFSKKCSQEQLSKV